jgi:hypothetical protein
MTEVQHIVPAPIRKTLRVRASRERAFEVFVARMGDWWARDFSIGVKQFGSPQANVVVEPHVGGRWYETVESGEQCQWGRVLAWEPPARLALAWQLTREFRYDPDFETTVEVTFTADGDYTEVLFEHRDLERYGEMTPEQFQGRDMGWTRILAGFEASFA